MALLNFWSSPYELIPARSLNAKATEKSRYGTLLKIKFANESIGYSDLHPWIEFGDESTDVHLASLQTASPTTLAQRSIQNAFIDAEARLDRKSVV